MIVFMCCTAAISDYQFTTNYTPVPLHYSLNDNFQKGSSPMVTHYCA